MKKLQEVIGLSVLDVSSGKKVGTVKDIYFDLNGDVKGFLVEGSGFCPMRSLGRLVTMLSQLVQLIFFNLYT